MRDDLAAAFEPGEMTPPEYDIPFNRQYEYMIHSLMKEYSMTKEQAGAMTEYDYCLMIGFKNIEGLKEKYLIEKR